ncbi:MAG TPA: ABC transporter permease [Thermoplasmata archaeon]|jgi:peptide/nickel transport system permease protein
MARGHSLLAYAVTRILLAVPMLFILLTALFLILRILPGDPVLALWGGRTPPASVVEEARRALGTDQPWPVQYWTYMSHILTGQLGTSIGELYRGQPVWTQISLRLPATIEIAIGSMLVATVAGVLTGVVAGAKRDTWVDVLIRLWGTIIWVIPIFWLGVVFQLIFGVWLRWLPPHGRWSGTDFPRAVTGMYTIDSLLEGNLDHFWKAVAHLILPCLTLGLVLSGFFTKTVRANLIRTIQADYTEAARARGLPERKVVYRHAFRNALVPVVTVLGLQFAILFAGAVLTEQTFSIEGIGRLLLQSITSKDMTMIQGVVVVYAVIIVGISLVIDILGALIDPRIRL